MGFHETMQGCMHIVVGNAREAGARKVADADRISSAWRLVHEHVG